MKRILQLLVLCLLAISATSALAATEVRMAGDFRAYGVFFENHNWTSWNPTGRQTEETFEIWQRWRLRSDFVANEAVKFRLGIRVNDTPWGYGTYTAANPAVAIDVYQAYLMFKWPGCDIQITAGLQPFSMPEAPIFYDSPVLAAKGSGDGATNSFAGLTIQIPVVPKTFEIFTGFSRLVDVNRTYDTTTTQVGDELDIYFLTLPITVDGFKITPWGLIAVAGKASVSSINAFRNGLVSGGYFVAPTGLNDNQNPYWWAGGSLEISALDPLKFYGDVMYGEGNMGDRERNRRRGWFIDGGLEYTGLDWATPQLGAWWSSGEDSGLGNGSERIPSITDYFGLGNTFFFPTGQEFTKNDMAMNPIGAWGVSGSLKNISFIDKLSHRATFSAMWGTNSPSGLRKAVLASGGNGNYLTMGKDLAIGEHALAANIDTKYWVFEKTLALVAEAGWAHYGDPKGSIWNTSRRFTKAVNDAWMASFGIKYWF